MALQTKRQEKKWTTDFFSGLTAGFLSVTVCAPLDITRTRLNMMNSEYSVKKYRGFIDAMRTIKREEGFRGFYKGYNATAISVPLFHSLFFTIYNQMKPIMNKHLSDKPLAIQHMAASTLTGFICDTLTNPLWVVRTRLQVQHLHGNSTKYNDGLFSAMRTIQQEVKEFALNIEKGSQIIIKQIKQEGTRALFKGLGASIFGLTHVAVYFPVYEYLKDQYSLLRKKQNKTISTEDIFVASLVSKVIACCITYPHIVIRTRLQDNRQNYGADSKNRIRIVNLVRDIYRKNGMSGLYSGLKVDLVRVLPANAITFVVYEKCKAYLEGQQNHQLKFMH